MLPFRYLYLAATLSAMFAWPGYGQFETQPGPSIYGHPALDQVLDAIELNIQATEDNDAQEEDAFDLSMLSSESRGIASNVYPNVAPSVVVVRCGGGHGTGLIVHEDGWILTNHHVIESAGIEFDTCARWASIHFGEYKENRMQMSEDVHVARVYKTDANKDLALLKLTTKPEMIKPIQLAAQNGVPGDDCFTVGHPARGLFWAVRSGELAGEGLYPNDLIDNVLPTYAMSGENKTRWEEGLKTLSQRKMFISTCGLNPGDSGGPLMNTAGELIAVNFAIPRMDKEKEVNYDKFSYHVHLDEVKKFLEAFPDKPEVYCPQHWPPAVTSSLRDNDKNEAYETWEFLNEDKSKIFGIVLDIDENTPATFLEAFPKTGGDKEQFDVEFVIKVIPQPRTYFDTDNDGTIDLCLLDLDGDWKSDLSLKFENDAWTRLETVGQFMTGPENFTDPVLISKFKLLAPILFTRNRSVPESGKTPDAAGIKEHDAGSAASSATTE